MSRKDYVLIARALSEARRELRLNAGKYETHEDVMHLIAVLLASELRNENRLFDGEKFMLAAGAAVKS